MSSDLLRGVLSPLENPDILRPNNPDLFEMRSYDSMCEMNQDVVFERIPMYCTLDGAFKPEFQKFYQDVKNSLSTCNWESLYFLSDRCLPKEEFYSIVTKVFGNTWENNVVNRKYKNRGCDLDVNPDRFRSIHRNIVGGLLVSMYTLDRSNSDVSSDPVIKFSLYHTELLFTYKCNRFVLISKFTPWVKDDE